MTDKSPDSKLEDFRYDAKLFKQAYNAGLKLKEVEEQQNRKKRFLLYGGGLLAVILFFFISLLIRNPLFSTISYVEAKNAEKQLVKFEDELETSPISKFDEFDDEFVEAKSAIYADLETGHIYYAKNIDEPIYIASITKLMSALVAIREFEMSEQVEIKEDWFAQENMSWSLGLDKGDTITVETLLRAMLMSSYNDAAFALADHMDGGWENFVEEMNSYAGVLGLENTHFFNPSGLDDYGANVSTAMDLYRITTLVYKNDFIMDTLSMSSAEIEWEIGDEKIYTTNAILNQYGNVAGKTGNTELAGGCFLGITESGRVTILLNAENRFDETIKLLTEL
jgi:D-alanyl-D-alanine carboxypeptidase